MSSLTGNFNSSKLFIMLFEMIPRLNSFFLSNLFSFISVSCFLSFSFPHSFIFVSFFFSLLPIYLSPSLTVVLFFYSSIHPLCFFTLHSSLFFSFSLACWNRNWVWCSNLNWATHFNFEFLYHRSAISNRSRWSNRVDITVSIHSSLIFVTLCRQLAAFACCMIGSLYVLWLVASSMSPYSCHLPICSVMSILALIYNISAFYRIFQSCHE